MHHSPDTPHRHVGSSRGRFYPFRRPGRCRRRPIRRQNGRRGTRRHQYLGPHPSPTRRHLTTSINIITRDNSRISGPRRRRTGAGRRKKNTQKIHSSATVFGAALRRHGEESRQDLFAALRFASRISRVHRPLRPTGAKTPKRIEVPNLAPAQNNP